MANAPLGRPGPNYAKLVGKQTRSKKSTTKKSSPKKSVKHRVPREVANAINKARKMFGKPLQTRKMRVQGYGNLQRKRREAAANLHRRMALAARNAYENRNFEAAIREEERAIREEDQRRALAAANVAADLERNLARAKRRSAKENAAERARISALVEQNIPSRENENVNVNALANMFGKSRMFGRL
jgi:hypothetical protein